MTSTRHGLVLAHTQDNPLKLEKAINSGSSLSCTTLLSSNFFSRQLIVPTPDDICAESGRIDATKEEKVVWKVIMTYCEEGLKTKEPQLTVDAIITVVHQPF